MGRLFQKMGQYFTISEHDSHETSRPNFHLYLSLVWPQARSHAYRILSPRPKHDTFFVILPQTGFWFDCQECLRALYWNSCHIHPVECSQHLKIYIIGILLIFTCLKTFSIETTGFQRIKQSIPRNNINEITELCQP